MFTTFIVQTPYSNSMCSPSPTVTVYRMNQETGDTWRLFDDTWVPVLVDGEVDEPARDNRRAKKPRRRTR